MNKLIAKPVTKSLYAEIKQEIETFESIPKLVILLIGNDPAASYYVNNLEKKGKRIGIEVETRQLSTQIDQFELIDIIKQINSDKSIHGLMIQKPLPSHIDEDEIVMAISPKKDVDGFHPVNMGNLVLDRPGFIPSTPAAVLEIIRYYNIEVNGRNVTILGRSNIVGKPLANLMLRKNDTGNATVTVCHSRTKDLNNITAKADILIAAIGKANFVKAEMIKEGAVVIDVGINQIIDSEGTRYVGDVDFNDCAEKADMITPVPGGVGSVTTALLLKNVVMAYKISN